jgi:hypothetical protein
MHPPASVPAYTYFQNLVIQAAHFSYPKAFALQRGGGRGGCKLFAPLLYKCTSAISSILGTSITLRNNSPSDSVFYIIQMAYKNRKY